MTSVCLKTLVDVVDYRMKHSVFFNKLFTSGQSSRNRKTTESESISIFDLQTKNESETERMLDIEPPPPPPPTAAAQTEKWRFLSSCHTPTDSKENILDHLQRIYMTS